jgi:hypothetical protein
LISRLRQTNGALAASEQIRMRVLAGTLTILLLGDQLLFLYARETVEQFARRSLPTWLPLKLFGPFLAYEIGALVVLRYRRARGKSMPTAARFANAVIETSLPTVILWWMKSIHKPARRIRCLADAAVLRLHRRLDLAPGFCASGVHRSRCGSQLSGNGVLGPIVRRRRR